MYKYMDIIKKKGSYFLVSKSICWIRKFVHLSTFYAATSFIAPWQNYPYDPKGVINLKVNTWKAFCLCAT